MTLSWKVVEPKGDSLIGGSGLLGDLIAWLHFLSVLYFPTADGIWHFMFLSPHCLRHGGQNSFLNWKTRWTRPPLCRQVFGHGNEDSKLWLIMAAQCRCESLYALYGPWAWSGTFPTEFPGWKDKGMRFSITTSGKYALPGFPTLGGTKSTVPGKFRFFCAEQSSCVCRAGRNPS